MRFAAAGAAGSLSGVADLECGVGGRSSGRRNADEACSEVDGCSDPQRQSVMLVGRELDGPGPCRPQNDPDVVTVVAVVTVVVAALTTVAVVVVGSVERPSDW